MDMFAQRQSSKKVEQIQKAALGGIKRFWQAAHDAFWKALQPLLLIVLGTTLIWWFLATVFWPAQNALRRSISVGLDSVCDRCRMEIGYPAIALTDSQATQIDFTLYIYGSRPIPLTALLTIPPGLTSRDQPASKIIRMDFAGDSANETKSIILINNNTLASWQVIDEELQLQFLSNPRVLPETHPPLIMGIEGTVRAALRRFGSREGDSAASLLPLATLFLSVAGLYYQESRQRQQRAEKAIEEERQKQLQREAEQRQEAKNLLEKFRKSIRDGKMTDANDVFQEINEKNLSEFLEPGDLRFANRLLTLISGRVANKDVEELGTEWPAETANALIYVVDNNPIDRSALIHALRAFPINNIGDLQQRFSQAREKLGADEPVQVRGKPQQRKHKELPYLASETIRNPFPEEKAENDVNYLFGEKKSLFWSKHPLSEVSWLNGLNIIAGESGSGKTAIAYALGRYMHHKDVLSCYFQGTPEFDDIRIELVLSLLKFIEKYPTYLSLLGREERNLLAQVISQDLGSDTVIAKLDQMLIHSSTWEWLDKVKDDQRKLWEREGVTHLQLFREAIRSANTQPIPHKHWALAIRSCAASMKFAEHMNVVMDTGNTISNLWLERKYLHYQQSLQQAGINFVMFVPESKAKELGWTAESPPDGCRSYRRLVWDEPKALENWINHRWKQANRREPLEALFAKDTLLQALIRKADRNPSRFIQLWNQIHKNKISPGPITEKMIKQA